MAKRMMCGWCATARTAGKKGPHERCPALMREARVTPLGKPLRELRCACRCKDSVD